MHRDYLTEFPICSDLLPPKLKELLTPVGNSASEMVDISCRVSPLPDSEESEHIHMLMAVVPESHQENLSLLREVQDHVVAFSTPVIAHKGCISDYAPSVSNFEYLVASCGDGSAYTYNLAEKVWMALGLTPRLLGNQEQKIVYDHLSLPAFGVAEGEVSSEFHFTASRNIQWRMLNEYLRSYLWLRGCVGVRSFYYRQILPDGPKLRQLMGGESQVILGTDEDWFLVDIREHEGHLLLQVWAAVVAISCERCTKPSADGLEWPGIVGPVTRASARSRGAGSIVLLDDKFLERYEQNSHYSSEPFQYFGQWSCAPAYRGQWSFTECVRVGRNVIKVPLRELYKPKPEREILHAHAFALSPDDAQRLGLDGEHIVNKTQRLLEQILSLGDNLSNLGRTIGIDKPATEWVGFSRDKLAYEGWSAYGQLGRLAQVAPLQMTQSEFLGRCKRLHEIWQRVPDGLLRKVLLAAGVPTDEAKHLKSLKLLQVLLNVVQGLDIRHEAADAFVSAVQPEGWANKNIELAPLFLNNDLRIADAHEAVGQCLATLETMGFEIASVAMGYGHALDFVFDGVIQAFESINRPLTRLLNR
jgi:hypothetical protein